MQEKKCSTGGSANNPIIINELLYSLQSNEEGTYIQFEKVRAEIPLIIKHISSIQENLRINGFPDSQRVSVVQTNNTLRMYPLTPSHPPHDRHILLTIMGYLEEQGMAFSEVITPVSRKHPRNEKENSSAGREAKRLCVASRTQPDQEIEMTAKMSQRNKKVNQKQERINSSFDLDYLSVLCDVADKIEASPGTIGFFSLRTPAIEAENKTQKNNVRFEC